MTRASSNRVSALIGEPRSKLAPSLHANVDVFLKNAKQSHRRFQSVVAALQNEGQILERLYYKGNNQHRLTLFWRKVSDIRKFSRQVKQLDPLETISTFYQCFFGSSPSNDATLFKTAWNHYPDDKSFQRTLDNLALLENFFQAFCTRSLSAYREFSLGLHSGAFLQTMLTLSAVASRIGYLSQEALMVIRDLLPQLQSIQGILSSMSGPSHSEPHAAQESVTKDEGEMQAQPEHQDLTRTVPQVSENIKISISTDRDNKTSGSLPSKQPDTAVLPKKSKEKKPKAEKVKKRKRDEIDDIFGF
ncbi:hypothetical protein FA15DRAFT_752043 [Coprinopsis marcescibilis]|uniref:Nucleolus and neural progenitor protein-like N-terminal domain-containing protein n=1 Tax=Coprinopsis marcescibilis TaxID=230819 RepID=A0A5C3LAR7_COPMA|nr:hypothetical protein FA15DRAFT_752043 [Coprinopsis marcescibilis]